VLSHGDYTHSQVLFDGDDRGLIDFDAICLAEPALDLAQFCAYLRVACRKSAPAATAKRLADRLCERFLKAYMGEAATRRADVAHLRERVAVYELVTFVRIALRSWQQLKPARTARALQLLEERMRVPARFPR
jgi:aminoglycoside phosphotransferase (APT) family kinase protein